MKKLILLFCFLSTGLALSAEEVFESKIYSKEVQQSLGSGTLSVATEVYTILVWNNDAYMKIEIPKKAFDLLLVGDIVRIAYEKGLFYNDIKGLALVKGVKR